MDKETFDKIYEYCERRRMAWCLKNGRLIDCKAENCDRCE